MRLLPDRTGRRTPAPTKHSFGLLEAVCAHDALERAYRRVRANGGGPGGDGVTLADISSHATQVLHRLRIEVLAGRYRPGPLRRHSIEKRSGGRRWLAIPCVADRILQTSCATELNDQLDARMSEDSYAYRPKRSVAQALDKVRLHLSQGRTVVVDADIERFFDRVGHRRLLQDLAIWIDDPRLLALVGHWLRSFSRWGRGLAQGAPISPVLANLYLHPVDRMLAAAGINGVRYADDFVLLCRTRDEAWRAQQLAAGLLAARGLRLNRRKTRIVEADEGFDFLGAHVMWQRKARKQRVMKRICP